MRRRPADKWGSHSACHPGLHPGHDTLAVDWNPENAAHLLRRAGFGATEAQVKAAVKKGFEKTLKDLLKPDIKSGKPPKKGLENVTWLQAWWLARFVSTHRPLTEKLTLFWHSHFATANSKVDNLSSMHEHVSMLRRNALGGFRDLLLGISTDPAMLVWLDNRKNYKNSVNENYARELMEVFTTGVLDKDGNPNYTETDVQEVARAFTGWSTFDGAFFFKADKHDEGTKTVKGVTGNLDGTDVIEILMADPATTRRIPQKLFSFFAYPVELTDPICDELQAVFVATDGSIAEIVEAIFRHDAFWSAQAKRALVKSPVEFLAGSVRLLQGALKGLSWDVGITIEALGQALYNPPSVFGWDEGLAWVSTSGLLERAKIAEWIADARQKDHPVHYNPKKLLGPTKQWASLDAAAVVQKVLAALDLSDASPATAAALVAYAQAPEEGQSPPTVIDGDYVDLKVRGLVALILGSPEFQMA